MFVAAVCILFLVKLKWPKNKSVYELFVARSRGELKAKEKWRAKYIEW